MTKAKRMNKQTCITLADIKLQFDGDINKSSRTIKNKCHANRTQKKTL